MMINAIEWWIKPRVVSVVIDNNEWMLPNCKKLVNEISENGDNATLCQSFDKVQEGGVAFFLSCHNLAPKSILERNHRNITIHASALPEGRGWSPLTWQILNGSNRITVCLFETVERADAGPIIYREYLDFRGDELIDEMRAILGELSIELCKRYLAETSPPAGKSQTGKGTYWPRRGPEDSALDPNKTIAEQFNLLRTVDNERYPAFFELHGRRYYLTIKKA